MSTSVNKFDSLEKLIYDEGIRISAVDFHPEMDVMLIILNTKAVLRQPLSIYPALKKADKNDLLQYQITGNGVGLHWPALDEDLSLKGFLRDELKNIVNNKRISAV